MIEQYKNSLAKKLDESKLRLDSIRETINNADPVEFSPIMYFLQVEERNENHNYELILEQMKILGVDEE